MNQPSTSDGPPAPATGNKVQRIAQHTQQLVDDLKEWVDLRVELARIELEERVEAKANEIALAVVVVGIALLAVVFGLVTIAFALGAWLGHPAWGFLIVTLLLVLLVVVIRAARPEFVQVRGRSTPTKQTSEEPASEPPSGAS